MAKIKKVDIETLLNMRLMIPPYQRPYKWDIRNIDDLLKDIGNAINDSKKFNGNFQYRIGTIILYSNTKDEFEIVDGQQRIISLVLLKKYLCPDFECDILKHKFKNKITQDNIQRNYTFIREWFSLKAAAKQEYINAIENLLEVIVITVDNISEAFQLFDSQNSRGKALDPHDLLKAYHLREMKNYRYEMKHAVTKWEAKDTSQIRDLFDLYLFPIWNWSRAIKTRPFTVKEIDTYKGITEGSEYSYARRASRAMPYFQITEPFIAGNDFFEMVEHYLYLLTDIVTEIDTNDKFAKIKEVINRKHVTAGFRYAKNLFYCALLCYYDKFHNFDEMAVKKLFIWAFMVRVDMEVLSFDTINKYSVADANDKYTNCIPMFAKISFARLHSEITSLQVIAGKDNEEKMNSERKELNRMLIEVSGLGGGTL